MLEMKIKIEADAAVLKAIDKLTTALEKNAVNISVPQDTPTPVAPVAAPVTHAPVPPVTMPSFAIKALKSSIFSYGIPGSSTVRREVKVSVPLPKVWAASLRQRICAAVSTPFSVMTRPEKLSVPRLSRKPCPLTRLISVGDTAIVT